MSLPIRFLTFLAAIGDFITLRTTFRRRFRTYLTGFYLWMRVLLGIVRGLSRS